jgi:hypothetical protein
MYRHKYLFLECDQWLSRVAYKSTVLTENGQMDPELHGSLYF